MIKNKIIIFLLILGIISGVWIFCIEPYVIQITPITILIKNLPESFNKIKIAHLTDLHSKNFGYREKKIVEMLNKLNPDFIFITGDIIDWKTKDFDSCLIFWKKLSDSFPNKIFAVYGNHEHKNPKFKTFQKFFEQSNIKILENESVKIYNQDNENNFIDLIGVDDPHSGYDDLEQALKNIDINNKNARILLAHSPEIFRKVKKNKLENKDDYKKDINLILVGHTHGAMINIPFLWEIWMPLDYDKKYKSGPFYENDIYMYVNRGIGTSFLPTRFNAFPEIGFLELINNDK